MKTFTIIPVINHIQYKKLAGDIFEVLGKYLNVFNGDMVNLTLNFNIDDNLINHAKILTKLNNLGLLTKSHKKILKNYQKELVKVCNIISGLEAKHG